MHPHVPAPDSHTAPCSLRQERRGKADAIEAQLQQQQQARLSTASSAPAQPFERISQFSQRVELYRGSVSTVYKGVVSATGQKVIIKAYHKSRMQPKHHHKLAREIASMQVRGLVQASAKKCKRLVPASPELVPA